MMTIRCSSGAQVARDEASASSSSLPIVVSGGTGYIGRFVVRELAARGHQVVALTRRKSGIGGAKSIGDVEQDLNKDAGDGSAKVEVRAADVTSDSVDALASEITASGFTPAAAVCCLASRTGGVKDSWLVDYEATKRFNVGGETIKVKSQVLQQVPLLLLLQQFVCVLFSFAGIFLQSK